MPNPMSGTGPVPAIDCHSRADFARVWNRIMPAEGHGCPIELSPPADAVPETAPPETEEAAAPAPVPEPPLSQGHVTPAGERLMDIPCLGASSAVYGALLQEFIDRELADWRNYLALSRRAPAAGGRALAAMAAEERRHGKRLSAAYFLISGVHYWPVERLQGPAGRGAFPALLRQCFAGEQRGAAAYLAAAEETADPALAALYQELARDEVRHAQLLRALPPTPVRALLQDWLKGRGR